MSPEQQRLHALEIDKLATELEQTRAERDQLRQHILDIDAHATPYGDIPDEPGYVGVYLLTAGALHRALGKIGHTAPKCEAEAALATVEQDRDRLSDELATATEDIERDRPILEAAFVRAQVLRDLKVYGSGSAGWSDRDRESDRALLSAVNAAYPQPLPYTLRAAEHGGETGRTRCPLCKTLPIGHEGDCEP